MSIIHKPLRYAHEEGHTDVCYSENGRHVITCGAEGDVRIWSVEDDSDPNHTCIAEWALSVRQKGDKIYVATGNNEIQVLSHPDGERDCVIARATDPFNQIALCKNKNIAAFAGEGMDVSVVDLDTGQTTLSFKDLEGPCISVALCPNATKVAAATGDGKLHLWDLDSGSLLKQLVCFPKVNSFANATNLCRMDFDLTGANLAYPEKNSIKILNTTTFREESLTCNEVSSDFSILQYSPCNKYLIAATLDGDFVVWETAPKTVFKVSKHEGSKRICALMWNPEGNGDVVYTDVEGQFSVMSNCSKVQRESREIDEVHEKSTEFEENEVDFGDFIDENERDGDANDDVLSGVKDADMMLSPEPELSNIGEAASSRSATPRPITPEIPLQAPFMPTSTPDHLDPRYLCWNEVGVVKSYGNNADDEISSKTVEVEFHDSTFHNSMMLPNFQDYSLGSIGKGALAVANSSQMMVIPLAVSNKEWSLKVEEYEDIVLVAASESLVCFATANYLIRICSVFGTQRGIVSVPGPLVSMAAFKNVLLVAYHAGAVRNNDQCINMKLFKFDGLGVESHDLGSALGPESTLAWLGFSDLGTPGMMDSLGILSLFPPKCNTWIPFCDTTKDRKSPGDSFFVTTVYESNQTVGGIRCKGTIYPGFVPRPTVSELPLVPPFAERDTDKTEMEANLFAWSNLATADTERKYKETALKIFALACKNDLDQRAFEFMEIVGNQQVLNLGLKYTTKLNKRRLAEKLMELASRLQEDAREDVLSEAFRSTPSSTPVVSVVSDANVIKPKPARLSLSKLASRNKKTRRENTQNGENDVEQSTNENSLSAINTQESLFTETQPSEAEEPPPRNPFLKKTEKQPEVGCDLTPPNPFLKRPKTTNQASPLSLTDRYAGVHYEKETKPNAEAGDKRKQPDSDTDKPLEKQRKLDKFMFSKR